MAIGRSENKEFGTTKFQKVSYALKKAVNRYFERPWHYLFYIALFAAMVAFFFRHRPLFEFYVILFVLGIIELFSTPLINKKEEK